MSESLSSEYRPEFYTNPALAVNLVLAVSMGVDLRSEDYRHETSIAFPFRRRFHGQDLKLAAELTRTPDEIFDARQAGTIARISGAHITLMMPNDRAATLTVGTEVPLRPELLPDDTVTDGSLEEVYSDIRLLEDEIATVKTSYFQERRRVTLDAPIITEVVARNMLSILHDGTAL